MQKDELYKVSILQCLARQCSAFNDIAKQHTPDEWSAEAEYLDRAMQLASGSEHYRPLQQIENCPMLPIFETVGGNGKGEWKIPAGELRLSSDSFATKQEFQPNHQPALEKLLCETENLDKAKPTHKTYAETLLTLLYKYTSQIPSGIEGLSDVSLYDYIKTTAAIAVSLSRSDNDSHPFLLLGADFSGIQSYIYTIVPKRAAKSLKGRSFYLRLLSDSIVRYLLKELGLYSANVVYNSGGCFYLLAPNSKEATGIIANAARRIEKALFKELGTSLYVALDYVELSCNALLGTDGEDLPTQWKALFLKRDKKKNHKFSSLLKGNYSSFFDTSLQNEVYKKDSITGEEFLPREKVVVIEDGDSHLTLRPITALQIVLGAELRDTDTIIVTEKKLNTKITNVTPLGLGFTYYFVNMSNEFLGIYNELAALNDKATIIRLNETGDYSKKNIYKIEFYGGNEVGITTNTYEDMSEGDSLNRLGVLRMDVDNLGTIFQSGIPGDKASLSRYAALSRSFDYFFSGYLNTIWKNYEPAQSQIIYSGGDDLFIVGRWDTAINLAEKIRNDFKLYTCYNDRFSLSGGVAIVPPKFPIIAAAEESADEESNAKEHVCHGCEKDSISFMLTPLNWDKEFKTVKRLKDDILKALQNKLPSSFIQKILIHHSNADIENHKIKNIKTYWMIAYDMKRMSDRIGKKADKSIIKLINNFKNEACRSNCTKLNGEAIETEYHPLELWAFAARWAELEERTSIKKHNNNG